MTISMKSKVSGGGLEWAHAGIMASKLTTRRSENKIEIFLPSQTRPK